MEMRSATDGDLAVMAELASRAQADPATVIAYLGVDADSILGDLEEIDWRSVSALLFDRGRLVGWLVGDSDVELGRVFWLGPFVESADWEAVAGRLYAHCSALLPSGVTEQEMAVDVRFERCQRWASTVGFGAEEGSSALRLEGELAPPRIVVRPAGEDDVATVGALHDELFAGTHTTGRRLVLGGDQRHVRLVTEIDGEPAGYVAVELQPDGSGYVDYLGVAPQHRRRGLGAELVRAGVEVLRRLDAEPIHLTVRESNHAARSLYASLGFAEDRVIRPLRKGFSLRSR
jgi:ribosomal protein S18 acetylase RimI-like enzyme